MKKSLQTNLVKVFLSISDAVWKENETKIRMVISNG